MEPALHIRPVCVAVIPCLNESGSIGPLVSSIARELRSDSLPTAEPPSRPEARLADIVIDDGSNDDTARLAAAAGAQILRHPQTKGKGAALNTGLQQARRLGFAWALTMDGDGQHAPTDIPAFLRCAQRTGAELVVGNRMDQCQRMPWVRRQVNRWMSRRLSRLAGRALPDSQCGFRLINLAAWSSFRFDAQYFEIESEMLLQFAAGGRQVEFVPVEVIYNTRQSRIKPWRDTRRWFRWLHQWKNAKPTGSRTC